MNTRNFRPDEGKGASFIQHLPEYLAALLLGWMVRENLPAEFNTPLEGAGFIFLASEYQALQGFFLPP
jgi:hypothetical protein